MRNKIALISRQGIFRNWRNQNSLFMAVEPSQIPTASQSAAVQQIDSAGNKKDGPMTAKNSQGTATFKRSLHEGITLGNA
jgi:hypothetical protein